MLVKAIKDEDFSNYKKPSMLIGFPSCTFKCDKEARMSVCQNSILAKSPNIEITINDICERYLKNPITSAIVCGGLEPFDSWNNLSNIILWLRCIKKCNDDFVIYTGYTEAEIQDKIKLLKMFGNIIIKVGRFIPNCEHHIDPILKVELASPNQYAIKIS